MADFIVTKKRIKGGVWEGELFVPGDENRLPQVTVHHLEQELEGVELSEDPDTKGRFSLRVPIPAEVLADGVQTFVISDADSGDRLSSFAIITGHPMEDDIRSELDLLRAELDMLKRAFRRHCVETM